MPTPACTLILVHFKVSNFLINLLSFCATFKWRWTFFCFFFLDIFLICYSESVESFEYSDVLIRLLMNTLCILCRIELPYVRAVSLTDLAIIYFVNFKGNFYFIRFFIASFFKIFSIKYIFLSILIIFQVSQFGDYFDQAWISCDIWTRLRHRMQEVAD